MLRIKKMILPASRTEEKPIEQEAEELIEMMEKMAP